MDYEQFRATFAEDLRTNLQKQEVEIDVSGHHIEELNDFYDALSVTPKGSSIGVNANLGGIFRTVKRGRDYSEVLSGITESLEGSLEHIPKLQVSDLTNYTEVKNKLAMEIVSAGQSAGMLQNVPHEQTEDITVVYHLALDLSKDASSTVLVTSDLMDKLEVTHEQLHNGTMKDTPLIRPAKIKGMEGTLNEIQGGPVLEPDLDEILFVAGIPDQNHGATVIAYPNFFGDAAEKLGGGYFIIPSNIYGVLLAEDTGEVNARGLTAMIGEVNATEVVPEDVLTDHAYHYDSKEHVFESADKFEKRQTEMEAAGPEENKGSLIDRLNARKEGAAREAPERATKDAVRKSRGGKAL